MRPSRLRIWLLALAVVLVGCGGHSEEDTGDLDASGDRKSDVTLDRASDATLDRASDATSEIRDAATSDAAIDAPPGDVRADLPVVDVRTDPVADIRVEPPVIDVRTDPVVDIRVEPPVVDVRIDPSIDAARDVRTDPTSDPTIDPAVDAGCSSDNQCGPTVPHCNTTTGTCASRIAIAVTPASTTIAAGTTQQFAATMTYSDTSTGDVTALAAWLSSNTPVATVNPATPGLATAVMAGSSSISATFAGFVGGTQLTVTAATLTSIQVTPANASSPLGTTRQFIATGNYSDNSTQDLTATAAWASSVPGVATIAAGGIATTVALGTTSISAAIGPVNAAVNFTVTSPTLVRIDVSPPNATILTLTTQDYQARGIYSDNSTVPLTQATWASSNPSIATLNGSTATGISAGTTTISASFNGVTGSTPLYVTGATLTSIDITPVNPTAPVGFNVQFKATGRFSSGPPQDLTADVFWGSSDDSKASISNAGGSKGLATALQQGTSTISATIPGVPGVQGSTLLTVSTSPLASIEVIPPTASIAKGTTQAFTATAHFMDATTLDVTEQVSWSSSALGVATVSNAVGSKGLTTSVSDGQATITAALSGANGSAMLTVNPATLSSITVTPANSTAKVGGTVNYIATGTYSDNSTQVITTLVIWTSTDTGIATISTGVGTEGVASAVATGDTTIQATLSPVTGSTSLHVDPP